jgi:hypothetical protein
MKELPHITIRLQNIENVMKVNWCIEEQWQNYAKSTLELFLSNPKDLQTVQTFLCLWATFCYNYFQDDPSQSNEYITRTAFPNFTINASLTIESNTS